MKKLGFGILFLFFCSVAAAQDLNATVQVLAPKIPSANKHILQSLETSIKDFINGRKWAQDKILPAERIECTFIFNITAWDGNSNYSAELQVQSLRPVFNSSYNSTLINMLDKDFDFVYTEGQIMDYSDQTFQSNLTSVLAFYAYIIVGMDYDTFSKFGGTPYFAAAQNVVTNAQSSSYKGCKAFDNSTDRYWLAENLNNQVYQPLRGFMYDYHRNGLDLMSDNASKARKAISDLLPILSQVDRQRVGAFFPVVFFTAKSGEFISIFTKADAPQRVAAMNILNAADPANGLKYQTLQKAN